MGRADFSPLAPLYAKHRPRYPDALFSYLADVAPGRSLAWDVATGSGQAATALAAHFDRVVATDISEAQLAHAISHPRVEYSVSPAERSSLETASADLVTVAQAVHWFDLEAFYAEARRVLRPGGILAVWGYHLSRIEDEIDNALSQYCLDVLAPHWDAGIEHLVRGYQELPFVSGELETPAFVAEADWTLEELEGFLRSWSATKIYADKTGRDPLELLWGSMMRAWGEPTRVRKVSWDLFLRVARV